MKKRKILFLALMIFSFCFGNDVYALNNKLYSSGKYFLNWPAKIDTFNYNSYHGSNYCVYNVDNLSEFVFKTDDYPHWFQPRYNAKENADFSVYTGVYIFENKNGKLYLYMPDFDYINETFNYKFEPFDSLADIEFFRPLGATQKIYSNLELPGFDNEDFVSLQDYLIEDGVLKCKPLTFLVRYDPEYDDGFIEKAFNLYILNPNNYGTEKRYLNKIEGIGCNDRVKKELSNIYNYGYLNMKKYNFYETLDLADKVIWSVRNNNYNCEFLKEELDDVVGKVAFFSKEAENYRKKAENLHKSQTEMQRNVCAFPQNIYEQFYFDLVGKNDSPGVIDTLKTIHNDLKSLPKLDCENPNMASDAADALNEEIEKIDDVAGDWLAVLDEINLGIKITDNDCDGILGTILIDDISEILTWIRISVPILIIILGSLDFVSAILSDDQKQLSKATSKFIKRCIIGIIIFFLPSLIMLLLSGIDKIYDVSCDIRLW